ncbi:hypothetical protein [Gilliamella sp. B3023]|uniref:hypothetical protein n=1 Tax=Gilliamella sp. B3023 TaxID=2817987 RepID=UPI00226ACCB3|nr:hypothetical protein [Gilliamella sp. B3023]
MKIPSRKTITLLNNVSVSCLFDYYFNPNDLSQCAITKYSSYEHGTKELYKSVLSLIRWQLHCNGESLESIKMQNYLRASNNTQRKWVVYWINLYKELSNSKFITFDELDNKISELIPRICS